ncbi:hypothetical protein CLAFUW4_11425 [Fulvia fulva]|uniref:Uncharacterized protein n=1 Tax=Passalora fulva TaxID=5499 RepID=A0A9Q8PD26_PASFU|nr:uncharacterized protein CLAFUR5_10466 [Fulvia fulva]KAK4619466.1 hypothetical protein CLAFUR4_11431 [Fulvia fulva]KAK4620388.1 hypothetical protein CLAFUR0_11437 [Fulvia fulva]UJO20324.1 hypothetical protein CLAFUR5_10466 [Fulvia fulva]WPV17089.1 hypothetical protein CLAFUW4_11425 [Fulvia fulva]WPV31854.1 hypothetical protein CLAFUW7_11421 [Fulvia fulva]
MALPHGFIENFGNVSMNSQAENASTRELLQRHIWTFHYPSAEILEYPERFLVDCPSQYEMRSEPRPLETLSEQETPLFAIFPLGPPPARLEVPGDNIIGRLLAWGDSLYSRGAGITELHVAKRWRKSGFSWGIRVKSPLGAAPVQVCEFSEDEWQILIDHADEFEWLALLRGLVTRASDRAWYHVQDRIGELQAQNQIEYMRDQWNERSPRPAILLLENTLRYADDNGYLIDWRTPLSEVFARPLQLPCGHVMDMSDLDYYNLSDEMCHEIPCEDCGNPIFMRCDLRELQLGRDKEDLRTFVLSNRTWTNLTQDFKYQVMTMNVEAKVLFLAVHATFESFKVPSLISPGALCFVNQPETRVALAELKSFLYTNTTALTGTPSQLLDGLLQKAMSASVGQAKTLADIEAVPGWQEALRACMIRAINFLLHRNCITTSERHRGLHRHAGGVLYYSARSWTSTQVSEDLAQDEYDEYYGGMQEVPATVNDIDAMMGDASM